MTENTDDPRDLAAGYALGVLTPDELERYEAFLAQHPRARHQADDFASTVAALGYAAPEIAPPPAMKADLMALIAQTPQLPAVTAAPMAGQPATQQPTTQQPATQPPVTVETPGPVETAAHRRWFTRPAAYLSAAAAAVVLIVGGITLPPIIGQAQYQQEQQTALEQVQEAPDAQRATDTLASGEKATVIWSASLGRSVLTVDGLAELPSDKTYELWYIGDAGPIPAGTFDSTGSGTTVRALDGTMTAGAVVAITVEAAGGSDTPTSEPILAIPTA